MKKIGRLGLAVLAIAIIASVGIFSVGCGNSNGNKKVEITFWEEDDPGNVDKVWDEIIKDFEAKNDNIHVARTHMSIESLRQNYQNAVVGGGGPSIVAGPDDNIGIFGSAGSAANLDEIFSDDFLSKIDKKLLDGARLNGTLYGIPYITGNTVALLYNKDIIKEVPKTMSELVEQAKAFGDGKDKFGLVFNMPAPYFYMGFLGAFGGSVFDENNNITLNTAEMKDTIEYLYSLKNDHGIIPDECGYDQANNLFKTGKAAFIINGPWSFEEYKNAGMNIGITCIPKVDNKGYPTPYVASKALMINKHLKGEKLDAAKKFIEFVCEKENQLKLVPVINEFPTNIEAIKELESLGIDELMQLKVQVDKCVSMPISPKMRAVWDGMTPTFQKVWSGKISSTAAIKEMQKSAEDKAKALGQ